MVSCFSLRLVYYDGKEYWIFQHFVWFALIWFGCLFLFLKAKWLRKIQRKTLMNFLGRKKINAKQNPLHFEGYPLSAKKLKPYSCLFLILFHNTIIRHTGVNSDACFWIQDVASRLFLKLQEWLNLWFKKFKNSQSNCHTIVSFKAMNCLITYLQLMTSNMALIIHSFLLNINFGSLGWVTFSWYCASDFEYSKENKPNIYSKVLFCVNFI